MTKEGPRCHGQPLGPCLSRQCTACIWTRAATLETGRASSSRLRLAGERRRHPPGGDTIVDQQPHETATSDGQVRLTKDLRAWWTRGRGRTGDRQGEGDGNFVWGGVVVKDETEELSLGKKESKSQQERGGDLAPPLGA